MFVVLEMPMLPSLGALEPISEFTSTNDNDDEHDIEPPSPESFASLPLPLIERPPLVGPVGPVATELYQDHDDEDDDDGDDNDGGGGDDIESLAAKAYAMASVRIPNYAVAFELKNKINADEYSDRTMVDRSRKSIALANKTSNIMADFQDYLDHIETQQSPGNDILERRRQSQSSQVEKICDGQDQEVDFGQEQVAKSDARKQSQTNLIGHEWTYEGGYNSPNKRRASPSNQNLRQGVDGIGEIYYSKEKRNYWYSCLRSKRAKVGIVGFIMLCALVGAIIGITSGNENEEELNKEHAQKDLEQDKVVGDQALPHHVAGLPKDVEPKDEKQSLPSAQNEGETAGLPTDKETGPAPINPAQQSAVESLTTEDVTQIYNPKWFSRATGWRGSSYADSIDFCATHQMTLCPYEAYCPGDGDAHNHLYMKDKLVSNGGPKEQWGAVSNEVNQWVQIGPSSDPCTMIPTKPAWGTNNGSGGGRSITEHILCCHSNKEPKEESESSSSHVETPPPPPQKTWEEQEQIKKDGLMYHSAAEKYQPRQFDRSEGWEGTTSYRQARTFCANLEGLDYDVCPYEAICPLGPNTEPLGGYYKEEEGGDDEDDDGGGGGGKSKHPPSWVPIADDRGNDWVNLSSDQPCARYSSVYSTYPEWGLTGIGSEEMTNRIICCKVDDDSGDDEKVGGDDGGDDDGMSVIPSSSDVAIAVKAYSSAAKYNPVWYNRSDGWTGQTYPEAISFCSNKGPKRELCPYDAYCPVPNAIPYGGPAQEPNGSWAPIADSHNEWVRVSSDHPCVRFSTLNSNLPSWGLTGEGNEDITRHIMCCEMMEDDHLVVEDTTLAVEEENTNSSLEEEESDNKNLDHYHDIVKKYSPKWYQRDEESADLAWDGTSYGDALWFCARKDSSIPCPYEAYCPNGPGSTPIEGSRTMSESWAPIMDIPNGWVNVGSSSGPGSCEMYHSINSHPPFWGLTGHQFKEESEIDIESVTQHIMCCQEPTEGDDTVVALPTTVSAPTAPIAVTNREQEILDKNHPIWFSRKHGYHGTTHAEAADFCKGIGDFVLCPAESYCPDRGNNADIPLFLQKSAFEGEQWAPVAASGTSSDNKWILVGTLDGTSESTCATFDNVKETKPKGWNLDDGDPDLKKHILCCVNPNHILREVGFKKNRDRVWLDESTGWKGGSHDDAIELCKKQGNKRLCPYTEYCPYGPGQPVVGGHAEDFNMEGEQWAPLHRDSNYWVQIGRKYENGATTCMDNWDLEGREPSWGLSDERADLKKHIMCCSHDE